MKVAKNGYKTVSVVLNRGEMELLSTFVEEVDKEFEGESLHDIYEQAESFYEIQNQDIGFVEDVHEVDGEKSLQPSLVFNRMEDIDGNQLSEGDMDKWERGEIKARLCDYAFTVVDG